MPDDPAVPSAILDHAQKARNLSYDLMVQTHRELGECITASRDLISESRDLMAEADRLLTKGFSE